MSVDWRAADRIKAVQGKRRAVEVLGAQIVEAEQDLLTAQAFEGEYEERLAAVERQIHQVAALYNVHGQVISRGDQAEYLRLVGERGAIEQERDAQLAMKTISGRGSLGEAIAYCPLRIDDVVRKLRHLRTAKDRTVQELADLEGTLTPGQVVQSGVPARDFAEHVERAATLRARVGVYSPHGLPRVRTAS